MGSPPLPASTTALCVLPIRTRGSASFQIHSAAAMPAPLADRMTTNEFLLFVKNFNSKLKPLAYFDARRICALFLIADIAALAALFVIDPLLLTTPWMHQPADLVIPLLLQFLAVLWIFPLISFLINRSLDKVEACARKQLEETSHKLGPRGVHFQVRRGANNSGAATNLWIEIQVSPFQRILTPVPVPTPYPVLALASAIPSVNSNTSVKTDPIVRSNGGQVGDLSTGGAASAQGEEEAVMAALPTKYADAAGIKNDEGEKDVDSAASATETVSRLEYLRVLQENQLLRQYLNQCQVLIQLQNKYAAEQNRAAANAAQTKSTDVESLVS